MNQTKAVYCGAEEERDNGVNEDNGDGMGRVYKISKRIQFLSKKRRLPPPPSNLAIKKIGKKSRIRKPQSLPQIRIIRRMRKTKSQGIENRHDSTKTIHHRHKISHMEVPTISTHTNTTITGQQDKEREGGTLERRHVVHRGCTRGVLRRRRLLLLLPLLLLQDGLSTAVIRLVRLRRLSPAMTLRG